MKKMAVFAFLLTAIHLSCYNTDYREQNVTGGSSEGSANQSDSSGSSAVGKYGVATDSANPCGMKSAFNIMPDSFNIVGGKAATSSDLVTKSTVKVILPGGHCTGTLIGPNQIVTAAHCFQAQKRRPHGHKP